MLRANQLTGACALLTMTMMFPGCGNDGFDDFYNNEEAVGGEVDEELFGDDPNGSLAAAKGDSDPKTKEASQKTKQATSNPPPKTPQPTFTPKPHVPVCACYNTNSGKFSFRGRPISPGPTPEIIAGTCVRKPPGGCSTIGERCSGYDGKKCPPKSERIRVDRESNVVCGHGYVTDAPWHENHGLINMTYMGQKWKEIPEGDPQCELTTR